MPAIIKLPAFSLTLFNIIYLYVYLSNTLAFFQYTNLKLAR